jgi:hypothetical protein
LTTSHLPMGNSPQRAPTLNACPGWSP